MASSTDLVLVTGASGYIATRIIQQLLQAGYRVRGTVRSLKNEKKMKPLYEAFPDVGNKLEFVEADLNDEKCWPVVVQDCTYVLHTASPIDLKAKHEEKVIRPAVEGTLSVLKASQESGTVKRVVMTSSIAAMNHCDSMLEGKTITSWSSWSDLEHHSIYPYSKSKISERAAWDFVNGLKEENKIELAVINPSVVMGPLLGPSDSLSLEIAKSVLNGKMLPRVQIPICDVRDVAAAHIKAMTVPEAAGHRHIAFTCSMWTREITEVVEKEFKPQGYNVSKRYCIHLFHVDERNNRSCRKRV